MNKLCFSLATAALSAVFLLAPNSAAAKDEWLQVRSKNFFLIGNASEKEIRQVATRLEQFRETFRQVFSKTKLDSPVPTNVVVFKSDSAYTPFKPKRANGKTDKFVVGFFQPGEDVNYVTLSVEGDDADRYSTIFHEYVHFILDTNFGKSEVPAWFNEGLADYYQTFAIEQDQTVKLGLPQQDHLALLQQSEFIPLDKLFGVSNYALLQSDNVSRSIFYAESWSLIHYLIQSGRSDRLGAFLDQLIKNVPTEKAFQEAFKTTYAEMEKELKKYVVRSNYQYNKLTFNTKLVFDDQMQVSPLSEAESGAYLGDLLYRIERDDDAEALLRKVLASNPGSSMANNTLGMVKMRQNKFDEAKTFFEKAISVDNKNFFALYQYAYLLSSEDRNSSGFVASFPAETAAKMRQLLKQSITLNPAFTESYELLAFIGLVNNEQLDEAIAYLQKALKYQPGNQRYALRIAEISARQNKFAEASAIADKIAKTAGDAQIKSDAENLLSTIRRNEEMRQQYETAARTAAADGVSVLRRGIVEKEPTAEEMEKAAAEANIVSINEALRKPAAGEIRTTGRIENISCAKQPIIYTIRTETETFKVSSADFQGLVLNTFDSQSANRVAVGCDANVAAALAVLTYKAKPDPRKIIRGELIAVEFVPKDFRLMEGKELEAALARMQSPVQIVDTTSPQNGNADSRLRDAMTTAMKSAMRKPAAGQRRALGFIERAECTNAGTFFFFKSGSASLKLRVASAQALEIRAFTPDVTRVQLGCSMKNVDVAVVITYKDAADAKAKSDGELIALEFVPPNFVLED